MRYPDTEIVLDIDGNRGDMAREKIQFRQMRALESLVTRLHLIDSTLGVIAESLAKLANPLMQLPSEIEKAIDEGMQGPPVDLRTEPPYKMSEATRATEHLARRRRHQESS
jgi:hypothetical protein